LKLEKDKMPASFNEGVSERDMMKEVCGVTPIISIVTAVYNRVDTIQQAIDSVQSQSWKNVEHVVIDGGSKDGTLEVLESNRTHIDVLISEPDEGIYDGLNKGYANATGDIIGIMHSDDYFADPYVLEWVANAFSDSSVEGVYGDLDYVSKYNPSKVIRRWRSGKYHRNRLAMGWMPPHPTMFLRRAVIEQWGVFDTSFQIAADYDAMLRYLAQGHIELAYIPRILVKMRVGGESNRSISRIILKSREDYRALQKNQVGGVGALVWKNISKLGQFF